MDDLSLAIGDRHLAVRDHGGEGRPIVLVHGGGDNLGTWEPVLPLIAGLGHVVSYDIVGHGWSDEVPDVTARDFDADLDAVLDWLGGGQDALLVGHSVGCFVTAMAAHRRRVFGIVHVDGAPSAFNIGAIAPRDPDEVREQSARQGWGSRLSADEMERNVARRVSLGDSDSAREGIEAATRRAHVLQPDGTYLVRPTLESVVAMSQGTYYDVYGVEFGDVWFGLQVPTIALSALRAPSAAIRDEIERRIVEAGSPIDLRWLDTGHSLHWEAPDAVAAAIEEAVSRA